ncbi:MAG: hypothetical protein N2690_00255 [Rhodocyclaceae bacterium]|nr:hypothetical protein [Rhodocyclaceae bacterium]
MQRLLACMLSSVGLLGCSHIEQLQGQHAHTAAQRAEAQKALQDIARPYAPAGLVRLERPLLGLTEVPVSAPPLPAAFEQDISFASFGTQSLPEILDTLARMTGLTMEAREVLASASQAGSAAAPPAPAGQPALQQQTISYRFSGKLRHLLDDLAARLMVSWRYEPATRRVIFYRYEHKIFNVMLPAGRKGINASISIGGSGGGAGGAGSAGGGGGSVSIQSDMSIDPWASLMEGVRVFLGQQSASAGAGATAPAPAGAGTGGSSSAMQVSGSDGYAVGSRDLAQLIVVARPQTMQRIAQFVEQTNRRFARNVLIDVRVVEIQINRNQTAGFSAAALLQTALAARGLTQFDVQLVGAPLPSSGQASQLTITAAGGGLRTQLSADAIVQALASVSTVAVRNQGQLVAINGQPAPFQQANQVSYLASIQTTQVPNVGAQTSSQQGTVTVGFTANFIPTIMADNRIMLQYQLQSSSLLGLRSVGPANAQIQVPEIYTQSLQQQAYVRDGDVIVLFGFEQERSQLGDVNGLWAQGKNGQNNQIMTAVIIQVRADKDILS